MIDIQLFDSSRIDQTRQSFLDNTSIFSSSGLSSLNVSKENTAWSFTWNLPDSVYHQHQSCIEPMLTINHGEHL